MTDLSVLIEKLEKAEAGSKELDGDVAVVIGWTQDTFLHQWRWVSPDGARTAFDPSLDNATFLWFTRSLDAALTLVPSGAQWKLGNRDRKAWGMPDGAPDVYWADLEIGEFSCDTAALSVPLALCIAALKARLTAD